MDTANILDICQELNTKFQSENVGIIEIVFRQINEPKVMLRLIHNSLSCIITIYLSSITAQEITKEELENYFNFLIQQETYRRECVKQSVISSK